MHFRFSIRTLLVCVTLVAAGVVYWKSQQPTGVRGHGTQPTKNSVHYIVESLADDQQLELVLEYLYQDDPQVAPIPITLSKGERVELRFEDGKFSWIDLRCVQHSAPQLIKDVSAEIKSGIYWRCKPWDIDNFFPTVTEAISLVIATGNNSPPVIDYKLCVRKKLQP